MREALQKQHTHHHLPPAPPLDIRDTNQAKEEVADGVAGGKESGEFIFEADGIDEDERQVVARDIDTRKLLHSLGAHAEDQAAHSAGAATTIRRRLAAKQHRPWNGVLTLKVDGPLDVLGLRNDIGIRGVQRLEVRENYLGLFHTVLGDQPSRALRQPGDRSVQHKDEQKLQGQREPPRNAPRSERHAVRYPVTCHRSAKLRHIMPIIWG